MRTGKLVVYSFRNVEQCVCRGVTLRPSLRESNLKKALVMLKLTPLHLPPQKNTEINSGLGTSRFLHIDLLPFFFPLPNMISSSLVPQSENSFHMSLLFLCSLPTFQPFPSLQCLSTSCLPLFVRFVAWRWRYSWTLICH